MNYRSIVRFASAAILTLSAAQVFAGDFYEDKGVALNSYDPISYFTPSPDPILGVKDLSSDYKGSKFYFVTPSHLHTFASDPAKYAPQYDGFDAYGVSQGRKVGGHPRVFALVDGKLYMFSDLESRKNWKKDIAGQHCARFRAMVGSLEAGSAESIIPQLPHASCSIGPA